MTRKEPLQHRVMTKKSPALCCIYYFPRLPEITPSKQRLHIHMRRLPKPWVTNPPEVQRKMNNPSQHSTCCPSTREMWQTALKTLTPNAAFMHNSSVFIAVEKLQRDELPSAALPSALWAGPTQLLPEKCHLQGQLWKALFSCAAKQTSSFNTSIQFNST